MNRLYAVESTPTPTGARADHRLAIPRARSRRSRGRSRVQLGRGVAGAEGGAHARAGRVGPRRRQGSQRPSGQEPRRRRRSAADGRARARARVEPCARERREDGRLYRSGRRGGGVLDRLPEAASSARWMPARSRCCLVLGGNPVATAPADLQFASRLATVGFRGAPRASTTTRPRSSRTGTSPRPTTSKAGAMYAPPTAPCSIVQPLIAPLYDGKTGARGARRRVRPRADADTDLVRAHWKETHGDGDFERWWRTVLHDGLVPDTAFTAKRVVLRTDWQSDAVTAHDQRAAEQGLELRVPPRSRRPRRPLRQQRVGCRRCRSRSRRLTWDNAVLASPATAAKLRASEAPRSRAASTARSSPTSSS